MKSQAAARVSKTNSVRNRWAKSFIFRVYAISKEWDAATQKGEQNLKDLKLESFKQSIKQRDFNNTLTVMEKLDFASTNSFSIMYDYMEKERQESIEGQLSIVKDYNSGKGDPSRAVARIERASKKRKDIFKKR